LEGRLDKGGWLKKERKSARLLLSKPSGVFLPHGGPVAREAKERRKKKVPPERGESAERFFMLKKRG